MLLQTVLTVLLVELLDLVDQVGSTYLFDCLTDSVLVVLVQQYLDLSGRIVVLTQLAFALGCPKPVRQLLC